jgi:hypothetical protein
MSLCLLLDHLLDSFALLSRGRYFNLLTQRLLSKQLLEQELLLLATHLLHGASSELLSELGLCRLMIIQCRICSG